MKTTVTVTVTAPDGTTGVTDAVAYALDSPLNYPDDTDTSDWGVNVTGPGDYPPGTPMITNSRETYPAVVLTPPATVAWHRVLAWAEARRRDGEYPGGIVLTVSNPEYKRHEYITWCAYTKDGGQTWNADTGHYIAEYADAWADFATRAQARPATEF